MIPLQGTPYVLSVESEGEFLDWLAKIEERVGLLRSLGTLDRSTILKYYGKTRFEQIAESNAIEGSTLGVGETELAVLKGVTITGHDPAYVRDAIALNSALIRLVEISNQDDSVSKIENILEIHGLILGDRPSAGSFRRDRVRISGSGHVPPKNYEGVVSSMDELERWSVENQDLPAPLRATVLHAWLAHIHPFSDGNGRTARAISNLELVRSGYPPIIIRKKERDRYIAALADSDSGGDISAFMTLMFERIDGALTGLETSAKNQQGFNPLALKLRALHEKQIEVWNTSVSLLSSMIELSLHSKLSSLGGGVYRKIFGGIADVDDFVVLCSGNTVSSSWSFIISTRMQGVSNLSYLAFVGHRSSYLFNYLGREGGPSLHWSVERLNSTPRWRRALVDAPYAKEITTNLGKGDEWIVVLTNDTIVEHTTSELAERISNAIISCIEKLVDSGVD